MSNSTVKNVVMYVLIGLCVAQTVNALVPVVKALDGFFYEYPVIVIPNQVK